MAINQCEITDFSLLFLVSFNSKETTAVSQKQENIFVFGVTVIINPAGLCSVKRFTMEHHGTWSQV